LPLFLYYLNIQNEIIENERLDKFYHKKYLQDLPSNIKNKYLDLLNYQEECCICYEKLTNKNACISGCGHFYCQQCRNRINKCALCRKLLN